MKKILLFLLINFLLFSFVSADILQKNYFLYNNNPINNVSVLGFICSKNDCSEGQSLFLSANSGLNDWIDVRYPNNGQLTHYGLFIYKEGFIPFERNSTGKETVPGDYRAPDVFNLLTKKEICSSEIIDLKLENLSNNKWFFKIKISSPINHAGNLNYVPPILKDHYSVNVDVILKINGKINETRNVLLEFSEKKEINFTKILPCGENEITVETIPKDSKCLSSVTNTKKEIIKIIECSKDDDCGPKSITYFCKGNEVWKNTTYKPCVSGFCFPSILISEFFKECFFGCLNGDCVANPINGVCGSSLNTCATGTFSDIEDNSTHYLWQCLGINGGTNASCSQLIPPNNFLNSIKIISPKNYEVFYSNYSFNEINLKYFINGTPTSCFYSLNKGQNISLPSCSNTSINAPVGNNSLIVYASNGTKVVFDSVNFSVILNRSVEEELNIIIHSPRNGTVYISTNNVLINVSINKQGSCFYNLNFGQNKTFNFDGKYFFSEEKTLENSKYILNIFCSSILDEKKSEQVVFFVDYKKEEKEKKKRPSPKQIEDYKTSNFTLSLINYSDAEKIITTKENTVRKEKSSFLKYFLFLLLILIIIFLLIILFILLKRKF
ncbi:MAG: hypothetical protein QXG18_01095 [Candidatus Pacearchaeota archaeon]